MQKIAIPVKNGQIDPDLGRATAFLLVTAEDGHEVLRETVAAPGEGNVSVVNLLAGAGATTLICGELGLMARSAFQMMELELIPGCLGDADEAVETYLRGEAQGDPSILSVEIKMDENDPMQCMHDCSKCGGCGDPEMLEKIRKNIPEV